MCSAERGRECGKEVAARAALEDVEGGSATLEGGEEATAQLWRRQRDSGGLGGGGSAAPEQAGRRRQRGYGGRGGGCSAVLKGGEEAVSRRDAFPARTT